MTAGSDMLTGLSPRPFLEPRPYVWAHKDRTLTAGIALGCGTRIRAHLTPTEARKMADELHDMADQLDAGTLAPTIEAEQE